MQILDPEYLVEIARQIAFLSAFLGGFSAAFLGSLLVGGPERRAATWATVSAAAAAVSFIVAVIGATTLMMALHPRAPASVAQGTSLVAGRTATVLAFEVGLYALLSAVGASGFLRSRRVGLATLSLAGVGALLATWASLGF